MTWFKVDDAFWGHPKQTALPPGPVALWVRAGSWSSDQLTDGLVPTHMVTMLGARKRDADQLVAAGLWETVPEGYQFHDWKTWQPSRQEVLDKRHEEAKRKQKWREKRAADKAAAEAVSQGLSQRDTGRTSGGTDAGVPAGVPDLSRSSRPDPTRPDPSSPTETTVTSKTSVGGVTEVDARDEPPLYPDHCFAHAFVAVPGKCGDCKDTREANRAKPPPLALIRDTKRCIVHDQTYTTVCSGCRADEIAAEESA